MDNKERDLCNYRIDSALETIETAKWCVKSERHKMW